MRHLLASRPKQILAIDYTTLEPTQNDVENILVMTDIFSKYTVVVPTRDQRAPIVAKVLVSEWFYKFGVPARLHLSCSTRAVILKASSFSSSVACIVL